MGILRAVSGFVDIDQLLARIDALIAENDERQKQMEKLELDLNQVQEELEQLYVLSREQNKIIKLNENLHRRTISLFVNRFCNSWPHRFADDDV